MQGLGTEFELMQTAVKPYPSCRYGHAGIDAALALRAEHWACGPRRSRASPGPAARGHAAGRRAGRTRRPNPQNVVDGQFSGPFVVGRRLATGAMGWDSYALLQDPAVRALLPKVIAWHDPDVEAEFPRQHVRQADGPGARPGFMQKVVMPKGEPENFLTEAELRAKFAGLADAVLGAERAAQLADAVSTWNAHRDVNALMRLGAPMMAARLAGE